MNSDRSRQRLPAHFNRHAARPRHRHHGDRSHARLLPSGDVAIDPMNDPNVGLPLALTRWITHFCAPVFVLLSGTSAGLMAARKSRGRTRQFPATRGLWLIFVEIFVISTAGTFAPGGIAQLGGKTLAVHAGRSRPSAPAWFCWQRCSSWVARHACALGAAIVLGHNAARRPLAREPEHRSIPVHRSGRRCMCPCPRSRVRSISCSCIRCCPGLA